VPASGDKIRAGKMLSKFLRQIAAEETELVETPEVGAKMATKAEALARLIFKMALGYTEVTTEKMNGQDIERERQIKPDKAMIQLVWDRLEGKAESASEHTQHNLTLSQRVDEAGKNAITAAGGLDAHGHTQA
jgi:hypothetical protein